jgi:hypothetical protein
VLQKFVLTGCLLVAGAAWFVTPAYAYIDPGTGSMLLQALIGGFAVAGAVVSSYYSRIKAAVGRWRGRDGDPGNHKDHSP